VYLGVGRKRTVEIYRGSISATDQHANAFARLGNIAASEQRGKGSGAAGLGDNAQSGPESALRLLNGVVGDENDAVDEFLRDGKHQFADTFGSERIRGDASRGTVYGMSGLEGEMQSGSGVGLDANDLDTAGVPGSEATNEAASADGNEQRVEVWRLFFQFEAERALTEKRFALIVGVNGHGTGLRDPGFAGGEGFGVAFAGDDELGAVATDAFDFFGRGHGGHEDPGWHAEFHGRVGDSGAVVSTGGGNDASGGNLPGKQVGERATRFEGAGVLEQFELEGDGKGAEAELGALRFENRCAADVRADELFVGGDLFGGDGLAGHWGPSDMASFPCYCT
jgi:hypothetical protein